MNEILFKAKEKEGDRWIVSNSIFQDNGKVCLWEEKWIEVNEKTVGQFIGFTDKKGRHIFKGDIIKCTFLDKSELIAEVQYNSEKAFYCIQGLLKDKDYKMPIGYGNPIFAISCNAQKTWELIGNIHSDPKLIKWED